jgi:hypothetical protein
MDSLIVPIVWKIIEVWERGGIRSWGTANYRYFISQRPNGQIMILRVNAMKEFLWELRKENIEEELRKIWYEAYDFPVRGQEEARSRTPRNPHVLEYYGYPEILILQDLKEVDFEKLLKMLLQDQDFFKI